MFFASRRMTLLAATVVATVISGCGATDKRPPIYKDSVKVKARLPAHASRQASHTSLVQKFSLVFQCLFLNKILP